MPKQKWGVGEPRRTFRGSHGILACDSPRIDTGNLKSVAMEAMLSDINMLVQCHPHRSDRNALDPRVVEAIRKVPRHAFVGLRLQNEAYGNYPLPIEYEQTISQPYIVAVMVDLLDIGEEDTILEIGTGCGYQTAILAELAGTVCTVEIIRPLALQAKERLRGLGYTDIEFRIDDGYAGWEDYALFDGIIVTAAAASIPAPLVQQLTPGGRLVMPCVVKGEDQNLIVLEKECTGSAHVQTIFSVRFVPLTRGRPRGF